MFNVDLDVLLQREAGNSPVATGAVPHILDRCLAEIEARGLQEPGLYRVPGASSAINNLRTQFDTGKSSYSPAPLDRTSVSLRQGQDITFFDRDYVDIFAICDVVKTWLRALPQSIFPEKSYQEAIKAIRKLPSTIVISYDVLIIYWNRDGRFRRTFESGPENNSRASRE